MANEPIYKVIFQNANQVFEVFARQIYQSEMWGFIEVEEFVFGERSEEVGDATRAFIRAILQYTDIERDPSLYIDPVESRSKDFFTQLLFTYKVNPRTALYLGYSDNYQGNSQVDMTQLNRTAFFKIGYAWVP